MAKKKKKAQGKGVLVGLGVVVVVVVVIGMLMARGGKQGKVLATLATLEAASGMHAVVELELDVPERITSIEQPIQDVSVQLDGDVARGEATEFTGTLSGEARGPGNVFFTNGEIRFLGDATAYRLEDLPAFFGPTSVQVDTWTFVDRAPLTTNNPEEVKAALASVLEGAQVLGREDGLLRFAVPVSAEQEAELARVLGAAMSGNLGWDVIARMLGAYDVQSLEVAVHPRSDELREVRLVTGEATDEGVVQRAALTIRLSEYGKAVQVERPEREAFVRPDVFGAVLGIGAPVEL